MVDTDKKNKVGLTKLIKVNIFTAITCFWNKWNFFNIVLTCLTTSPLTPISSIILTCTCWDPGRFVNSLVRPFKLAARVTGDVVVLTRDKEKSIHTFYKTYMSVGAF